MNEEYIVAIDFGKYETRAWIVPLDRQEDMVRQGEALCLKRANVMSQRVLPSRIFADPSGGFSIYDFQNNPIEGLKARVSELKKNPEKFNAYKAFIKEVYKLLVNLNETLQYDSEGNTNFYLCIACPDQWSDNDRREYYDFFNEALDDLNVKILLMANESDAIFYAYRDESECGYKSALVIGFGNDAIKYTVVDYNQGTSYSSLSNTCLGTSSIEDIILAEYGTYSKYQQTYKNTEEKLRELGIDFINIHQRLKREIKHNFERGLEDGCYPAFDFVYNIVSHFSGIPSTSTWTHEKWKYQFEYTCDLDTVLADYKEAMLADFQTLANKIKGHNVDCVILGGSASLMPWVREYVKQVFNPDQVILSNMANYAVAKGIALYAAHRYLQLTSGYLSTNVKYNLIKI